MTGRGDPISRDRAQQLRRAASKPERLLWSQLRGHKTGFHFRRQHAAGPYVLDFYCAAAKLCVEVDGQSHQLTGRYDETRDNFLLHRFGIATVRVSAKDVLENLEGVASYLAKVASERAAAPTLANASCSP